MTVVSRTFSGTKTAFQTAIQSTPAVKPLFDGDIDNLIEAIAVAAEDAESTFWEMVAAEFSMSGYVTVHDARDTADTSCAQVITPINDLLTKLAAINGATHTPISWSGSPQNGQSLYAPFVRTVCDLLLDKTERMREVLGATADMSGYTAAVASLEDVFTWALAAFNKFGPYFPTPFTAFHSCATQAEYYEPTITAEVSGGKLLLTNTISPGTTEDIDGAVAHAFHTLASGDSILIESLDIVGYEKYVGLLGLTLDTGPVLDPMTLKLGTITLDTAAAIASGAGSVPGDCFKIRKLKNGA